MQLIAKVITGSQLHGTAHPKSDTDLKGVQFIPLQNLVITTELVENIYRHNDQLKEENIEMFSLQSFLRLTGEGQTIAYEMLHAPEKFQLVTTPTWNRLRENRHRFNTKKIVGFVAYAKKMADKYTTRSNRLFAVQKAIAQIETVADKTLKLKQIWNDLPESPHTTRGLDNRFRSEDKRAYHVCGRSIGGHVSLKTALETLYYIEKQFGSRVRQVLTNPDEDLKERKALSHAFRAGHQVLHLVRTGDIPFPLPEAEFLKGIKMGTTPIEGLAEQLEELLVQAETETMKSNLPDAPDPKWAIDFVLQEYNL